MDRGERRKCRREEVEGRKEKDRKAKRRDTGGKKGNQEGETHFSPTLIMSSIQYSIIIL